MKLTKPYWKACILALLMSGIKICASAANSSQDLITMNFQDVDISVLAKFISEITGKNFVLDDSVRGKVSVVSPTKVTPEQAYSIFKSVLQLKGFATVTAGPVIKIIPSRDVRGSAPLTQSQAPAEQEGTDEYVTRMIKLRNVDSSALVNVIQPMVTRDGLVAAFPQTNTLIISDDAWNVQRLLAIIGSLDVQGLQESVSVIPLKLAYADDIAPKIEQIMEKRPAEVQTGALAVQVWEWSLLRSSAAQIKFTLPAKGLPNSPATGPGSFVVSNAGAAKTYSEKSNAVSAPIGAKISVLSVSQTGSTITVHGTGFSTLTVINFFNKQGAMVVNLGGLIGGIPKIHLTFVNDTTFTFTKPAGSVAGPSYVQALNPPFVPFTSSGNDPGSAFTLF